ncbi:M6 family metalloprotease domain-containing protein [Streptomyces sp. ISL-10]|uniref:M6 family metalloprotease domain-containing protein n=1 Tax=Streptomyces sp. ISL-10 TaxID=2819172 RepID=UPI001BE669F8|nr:M6 family metalloprotease domain-containing protein [Streptomyces sp. ISL-10]MBT2369877.1 M6 family metalloprotease domain-containing protein [Streptomyces sp. ISL-10]
MSFSVGARRVLLAAPPLVLSALLALLALVIVPAGPAHAYNGSTSACALQGTTGYTDEGQQTDYNRFINPTGTKRVGVLYVDFPDAVGTTLPLTPYYNQISGAAQWLWDASYGKTWLDMQVPNGNWVRMPKNSNEYNWERGFSWNTHQTYVKDALTGAANAGVNLANYDMFYIVPTSTAAAIAHSPTFVQDPNNVTWVWNTPTQSWVKIHSAVTFGQDIWTSGYKVAVHETGHTFGLPDLYAFSGTLHQYVGGWDVMGNMSGPAPQYFGWHAWKFGWINDNQVSCLSMNGTYSTTLKGVEYWGSAYKLAVIRTSATTAYVAESRKAVNNDSNACATGVVIYKVDTSITTGNGPIRVVTNPNAAAPTGSCTSRDMQTWKPGQYFQDDTARIRIYVNSSDAQNDTVWTYKW